LLTRLRTALSNLCETMGAFSFVKGFSVYSTYNSCKFALIERKPKKKGKGNEQD
jgi:hypothetical protein